MLLVKLFMGTWGRRVLEGLTLSSPASVAVFIAFAQAMWPRFIAISKGVRE